MFPPELQVKQYVARLKGAFGFHWYVYKTGSDRHYLFVCAENSDIQMPVLKTELKDEIRSALAGGRGHAS